MFLQHLAGSEFLYFLECVCFEIRFAGEDHHAECVLALNDEAGTSFDHKIGGIFFLVVTDRDFLLPCFLDRASNALL